MEKRNQLDERQEQIVLKIEHNGCWFAFWALLVALFVEQFIFGFDFKYIAGEWIIFMILAVYLCGACLKNGIWDRHLRCRRKCHPVSGTSGGFPGRRSDRCSMLLCPLLCDHDYSGPILSETESGNGTGAGGRVKISDSDSKKSL